MCFAVVMPLLYRCFLRCYSGDVPEMLLSGLGIHVKSQFACRYSFRMRNASGPLCAIYGLSLRYKIFPDDFFIFRDFYNSANLGIHDQCITIVESLLSTKKFAVKRALALLCFICPLNRKIIGRDLYHP